MHSAGIQPTTALRLQRMKPSYRIAQVASARKARKELLVRLELLAPKVRKVTPAPRGQLERPALKGLMWREATLAQQDRQDLLGHRGQKAIRGQLAQPALKVRKVILAPLAQQDRQDLLVHKVRKAMQVR